MATAAAMTLASGCTLALDWTECTSEDPCGTGYACVGGTCQLVGGGEGGIVPVNSDIVVDTTWTADNTYVLKKVVYVSGGATLSIRSGTRVLSELGAALIVRPGARIDARGTEDAPIVFTSASSEGERAAGDWGGVILMGRADVNEGAPALDVIEEPGLASFGGSDDEHACGVLQYTRIEFGGFEGLARTFFDGLTLAGCGSDTLIDHVQVHRSAADGIQIIGGAVGVTNVVASHSGRNAITVRGGWRGSAQYVYVNQGDADGAGLVTSNNASDVGAEPRTNPRFYNFTIVGSGQAGGSQRGLVARDGGGGEFANGIFVGQGFEAVDIIGAVTAGLFLVEELSVETSLFFDIGAGGTHFFPTAAEETGEDDDDAGFDEGSWINDSIYNNLVGVDPQLTDPYGDDPAGAVPPNAALSDNAKRPPADLDDDGKFFGAFEPASTPWTADWTAFPAN